MIPCKMRVKFFKATFWKPERAGYFQIIVSAVWFSVFQWNFAQLFGGLFLFARINLQRFAWIFFEILWSKFWENWKTWKSDLVPMSRKEKLADLFLIFPTRLKTWPKVFHSYRVTQKNATHENINKMRTLFCIPSIFGIHKLHSLPDMSTQFQWFLTNHLCFTAVQWCALNVDLCAASSPGFDVQNCRLLWHSSLEIVLILVVMVVFSSGIAWGLSW